VNKDNLVGKGTNTGGGVKLRKRGGGLFPGNNARQETVTEGWPLSETITNMLLLADIEQTEGDKRRLLSLSQEGVNPPSSKLDGTYQQLERGGLKKTAWSRAYNVKRKKFFYLTDGRQLQLLQKNKKSIKKYRRQRGLDVVTPAKESDRRKRKTSL